MRSSNARSAVSTRAAIVAVVLVLSLAAVSITYLLFGTSFYAGNNSSSSGGRQVSVTDAHLRSADFTSGGSTTTSQNILTCGPATVTGSYNKTQYSPATGSYLVLSNTGTRGTAVEAVTITWKGATNNFTVSGTCDIGAFGSATALREVLFPATSLLSNSASVGGNYTGTVTLTNGGVLLFTGPFQ